MVISCGISITGIIARLAVPLKTTNRASQGMTMLALATCCLMTLAMGTLHAWSVLSTDLEVTLGLSRAQSSLVYPYSGHIDCDRFVRSASIQST